MRRQDGTVTRFSDLLKAPVRRVFQRWHRARLRTQFGLIPISETHENDVFIVGYPKSGNTWLQNLVAGVIYGMDPRQTPDCVVQDLVPNVHGKKFYKRYRAQMFFKTHELPRPDYRNVVYLLRDGRDVMVSYYWHNMALQNDSVDFGRMVETGEGLFLCKWHEHVERWRGNPFEARILTITYEDLKRNPVHELSRLCEFANVDRGVAYLQQTAAAANFESMVAKEQEFGWASPRWPKDKPFVRRGIAGSYKDEMPADVLRAFLDQAGQTLRKCGYEV